MFQDLGVQVNVSVRVMKGHEGCAANSCAAAHTHGRSFTTQTLSATRDLRNSRAQWEVVTRDKMGHASLGLHRLRFLTCTVITVVPALPVLLPSLLPSPLPTLPSSLPPLFPSAILLPSSHRHL